MEKLKVVIIGAASPQWGHRISRDFIVTLSDKKLCDSYDPELVMEDIDSENLKPQAALARLVAEKAGGRVKISETTNQKEALEGARFVVISFAEGTLEHMQYDLDVPQEYGIYQPVGDTVSIGGAIRAARNIPGIINIGREMEELSHSDAWILNLANPMSTLCRALTRETKVPTIGCCHELYGVLKLLSKWLSFENSKWREILTPEVVGINHCGWLNSLKIEGNDGLAQVREFLKSKGITSEVKKLYNSPTPDLAKHNVKINLFLRHGCLPISGDRHTSEFFTEFVNKDTNKGADYGVLLTTPQERLVKWRGDARAKVLKLAAGKEDIDLNVSQEAASKIMLSLLTGEEFIDIGNVPYHGDSLPGVPDGAVLERMITYGKDGPVPAEVSPLPKEVHQHFVNTACFIEDVVEAGVTGNRALLINALRKDYLLKNMSEEKIPELVDRLLTVHKTFVHPGFF